MFHRVTVAIALMGLTMLALAGCRPPHAFVEGDGDEFPRLRFAGGGVSPNDRCPVRKNQLNRRLDAVLVNGRPIGFC